MTKTAYLITSPDPEDGSVVVFASSEAEALEKGINILGEGYDEEEYYISPAPQFQEWEQLGYVPEIALLQNDWWIYSEHYGTPLREACTQEEYEAYKKQAIEEDWNINNDGVYPVDSLIETQDRRGIYMHMLEVEDHAYFIKEFKDTFQQFKDYVTEKYPDFEIVKWSGDYPSYTKSAEFVFPSSKYVNEIRWQSHEDPIENVGVWVCQGDAEAFDAWRKT